MFPRIIPNNRLSSSSLSFFCSNFFFFTYTISLVDCAFTILNTQLKKTSLTNSVYKNSVYFSIMDSDKILMFFSWSCHPTLFALSEMNKLKNNLLFFVCLKNNNFSEINFFCLLKFAFQINKKNWHKSRRRSSILIFFVQYIILATGTCPKKNYVLLKFS